MLEGNGAKLTRRPTIDTSCRLCGESTTKAFDLTFLDRYEVKFYRCSKCESLETESPYWLDQAYQLAIASTDTGAVIRNAICSAAIVATATVLKVKGKFLDFGGGTGLLCRMLRDRGFDAHTVDPYSDPVFARGFSIAETDLKATHVSLLSAIEVFEHLAEPSIKLGELFALKPRVLFATTVLYRGEGRDWWYIGKHTGQHIFFYTGKAMRFLAEKHGYDYFGNMDFHVFSRDQISSWQRGLMRMIVSPIGLRMVRLWMTATQRGNFADRDFKLLAERTKDEASKQDQY